MNNQDTDKDLATLEDDFIEELRTKRKQTTYFIGWKTTPKGMVEVYKENPNEKTN